MINWINVLILLAVTAGLVYLQVYLSRISGKTGLILPCVFLVLAVILTVTNILYSVDATAYRVLENGETIPLQSPASPGGSGAGLLIFLPALLCMSLPAAFFFIIHLIVRAAVKHSRKAELDRMDINDL